MSTTEESTITSSTRKEVVYQDAVKILKESGDRQSKASSLIISLRLRTVTWFGITIISSIVCLLTFYRVTPFIDSQKIEEISQKVTEIPNKIDELSKNIGEISQEVEDRPTSIKTLSEEIDKLSEEIEQLSEKYTPTLAILVIISGIICTFGLIQTINLIWFQIRFGKYLKSCKDDHDYLEHLMTESPANTDPN